MSVLGDTLHAANGSEEVISKGDVCPRRLSRVSRLRDMFQNGIVRPIDDAEDGYNVETSVCPSSSRPELERFSRAFPGSPPIKTLRHHRTSLTKNESTQQSISSSRSVDAALSSGHRSLLQSPPKRPPKPRHLCLSSPTTLEAVELKPVASKISVEKKFDDETSESLKISTTDNQPSAEKVNGDLPHSNTAQHSAVSSSHISAIEIKPHQVINDDPVERLSYASITPFYSFKKSAQPTENGLTNNDVCQESCDAIQSAENPHLQSTKRSLNLPIDHHCASANSPEIQDFVLPPDAFHTAPFHGTACETASNDLPVLQHAETVAVDTPDDEDVDDKVNDCVEHHTANSSIIIINGSQCTSPFSPLTTLPIPKGLNVVAVDADGVHIFEDGNFLYALPGLNDKCSDDSDFYDSREDVVNISDLIPSYTVTEQQVNEENDKKINLDKFVSISSSSNPSKPQTSGKLVNKCTGSNDSLVRQPRVRFSSEPILVFSTHSTTDYNRRNEEIDPLSASAEYELEKHLEDMDMFEIDFHKGANGLGISIVGSGVDTSSGEQKLSIFIKSLTPGGAAEADGRIQVYDQIVQVDGHSLVGVSQQFAAQALQSTGEIIHFVLARDKDPPNSRIAKILSEKQEEDEEDAKSNKSPDKSQEMAATQTDNVVQQLSGGDSTEALHNLIAVATRTLKQANEWDDDDEDEDIVAENEEGEDFELESSCAKYILSNIVNDTSPVNGCFEQFKKSTNCVNNERNMKIVNGSLNVSDRLHSSPRSALKGTATAASTRRRNEAIMEYIRQAVSVRDNVCLPSDLHHGPTDVNKNPFNTTDYLTPVSWALASELHDCTTQLRKLHSRVRNLEQRLTAQEAAADEAIERLCLRCRHLELELKESHQKNSQTTIPQHNTLNFQNDVNSDNYSLGESDIFDPRYQTSSFNMSYKEDDGIVLSTNSDTELGKFPRLSDINEPIISTQSHVNGNISLHGRHLNYDEDKVEDNNNDNNGVNSLHTQHDHYSTTVELPFFLRQAQDRTRLVNSGGLAGRRPPTRIVTSVFLRVNSPFASFHGTSATSSSHSQVISNSNPFNANNHSSCETIFSNCSSTSSRPLPPSSFQFHCSPNINQSSPIHTKLVSKGSTDCKILPKQTPPTRKPISYQLPGLTDNSFQTLVLRRSNICTDLSKSLNPEDSES